MYARRESLSDRKSLIQHFFMLPIPFCRNATPRSVCALSAMRLWMKPICKRHSEYPAFAHVLTGVHLTATTAQGPGNRPGQGPGQGPGQRPAQRATLSSQSTRCSQSMRTSCSALSTYNRSLSIAHSPSNLRLRLRASLQTFICWPLATLTSFVCFHTFL